MPSVKPHLPGNELPATRDFMRRLEEQAMLLRQRANVSPLARFDPRVLVEQARLRLVYPSDVAHLPQEILDYFSDLNPRVWSGMGKSLSDGVLMVLLNPSMTVERENVTILEEVFHVHYGHRPSQLIKYPNGWERRMYDRQAEQEAYWSAAAALLPSKSVALAVWRGQTAEDLCEAYHASPELAEMRIKTLGLWLEYQRPQSPMRRAG